MIIRPPARLARRAAPAVLAMVWLAGCSQAIPGLETSSGPTPGPVASPATSQVGAVQPPPPPATGTGEAKRTAGDRPAGAAAGVTQGGATAPPSPIPGTPAIVGFKGPLVTLYASEASFEGERLAATAIPVPIRARSSGPGSGRVEIATVAGPRWIDRAEVVMGSLESAGEIRR